jgi:hypothetical protein
MIVRSLRHVGYDTALFSELAVFACDFSKLLPRPDFGFTPACAVAFEHRRRPLCGSPEDREDRIRLREALLARRDPRMSV